MIQVAAKLPARIAGCTITGLSVREDKTAFEKLAACAQTYFQNYQNQGTASVGQVAGVQHARQLFRGIGIDPTKRRPSSEALLNRAIKQKGLYSVNTLVDVGNWCSLDFLLPIGIYDIDQIEGTPSIRLGLVSDVYPALNNTEMNLHNRYCLADEKGAFGSPITDSKRTSITTATTRALLVIYAPEDYDVELLQEKAQTFADRTIEWCRGKILEIAVMP